MTKLIRADIYRLLRKKSLYVYFGGLAVAYLLLAYVRSGGFTAESTGSDAMTFFGWLPAFAGGLIFASVFTDDLDSKSLTTLVGSGLGKARIVVARLILTAGASAVVLAIAPVFHCAIYAALGWPPTAATWALVYAAALKAWLMTIGFAALSAIVVYGAQRTTLAVMTYVLLAFGVVSGLMTMALNSFGPNLIPHLLSSVTGRVQAALTSGGSPVWPLIEFLIYVVAAVAAAVLVFRKKEMEF